MAAGAGTTVASPGQLEVYAINLYNQVLVIMVPKETSIFPRQDIRACCLTVAGDLEGDHVIQVKEILIGIRTIHVAHAAKSKENTKTERIFSLIANLKRP